MIDLAVMAEQSRRILNSEQPPEAVGIFGLQDNYWAIAASGVAAAAAAPDAGPLGDAVIGAGSIHLARAVNARARGVSIRMVVAVTADSIALLSLPAVGSTPERELLRFDRATTTVRQRRFGLSRRILLSDSSSGKEIGLTSSAAPFSAYAAGAKAVLAALT